MATETWSESTEIQKSVKISGTVKDAAGEGVIGATVLQKGSSNATATGIGGSFELTVPEGATLVVTYIGYQAQEVKAAQGMVVTLAEDLNKIEDVVVTAEFGMKRVARAMGSSVQNVKAQDIIESGRADLMSALQGRVSGMTVTSTSGMPGASSTVVLRNITSLSGSNEPLYVVDGIPMDNSTFDPTQGLATAEAETTRSLDYASRGNDFNMEDVASITVLKGAAAAALYGSDASNGAIIITTKKGANTDGKGRVSYNNQFSWSKAYGWPEVQDKYGHGTNGSTNYYYNGRWGSLIPEDMPTYDNVAAVLQTGFSQKHNVSIESGTDKMSVRGSASYTGQKGVVKTTDLDRLNFSLAGKATVKKWLTFEGSMQYVRQTNNKVNKGTSGPIYYAYRWPSMDDMRNIYAEDGLHMRMPDYYMDDDQVNPLFGMYNNVLRDETDRFMARGSINITPIKNTFIRAQAGIDYSASIYENSKHPYYRTYNLTSKDYDNSGSYNVANHNLSNYNLDVLAGYNNSWFDGKFTFGAQVGYHQLQNATKSLATYGDNFLVINFHSINNCSPETITSKKTNTKRRLQAISAQAEFGYNNMAFVTLRARNDWSSTLPKDNNSYFYPAVEGSFVFTEIKGMKDLKWLNYLKVRGAFAQVGKDAKPLAIDPALEGTGLSGGGFKYGYTGPNPNLVPEMNTSYEVGLESRLANDRINLDFTYFWTYCQDQIVNGFRMSYATGFVLNNMNVGSFKTWGWEGHIDGDIIRAENGFRWNLGLNLSHTGSLVTDLPENLTEYYNAYTWNSGNTRNGIMKGHPITTVTGRAYERNKNGDILVSTAGIPQVDASWSVIGDRNPDLNYGISTALSYKGFRLSAMASGKIGATIVNGTMRAMWSSGQSWESVRFRESGEYFVFKGVVKDGMENTDTPTWNTVAFPTSMGGSVYSGGDEDWIQKDVNFLRLSEVRLTYNLPSDWLKKATKGFISRGQVFVSANDLCTWTNYMGVDPVGNTMSAAAGGTGGEGYDLWGVPAPRTFSFGVSLTF
ncbi:MAG: SusC/RagA family TonB-linked outer membrane protein [Rikenellaceae bacterium]|nr:SusC/RagA family TonB-linked outer membrane protein [Rikenellaceae bacterium]